MISALDLSFLLPQAKRETGSVLLARIEKLKLDKLSASPNN
jgi:hypothetical protein